MARRRVDDVVGKRYWREAEARVVVGAWRRSGMSLGRFAREHRVEVARVARWAARLRAVEGAIQFHPVRVVGAAQDREGSAPLEIMLRDGRRVRVPAGFAAEDLRRVLEVLEGTTAC